MKLKGRLFMSIVVVTGLFLMFACGGSVISLADIPVFPGAEELKAGESDLGNTLKNNMEADKKVRESMGPLAAKGSVEQKGFSLPAKSQWKDIKDFYDKELTSLGWKSGLGGVAGKFVDVNKAMNAGGNKLAKTIIYSRGKQTLTIVMVTTPKKHIILSLSTT
ncbi:MAG: hypothetical protein ABFR75_11175 [Acidobacteriota bacterium]